ncbi:MAG: hypothetical protein JWR34_7431 [Mycobacterium sp.]|nr:hypothetical protein [Mycobacterium sp.]
MARVSLRRPATLPGSAGICPDNGSVPRVSAEERVIRDALVARLFVAGVPLREIAAHPKVRLSRRGVEMAVRRHLALDTLRSAQAEAVHIMRLESLLKVALPKALAGDLKAAEHARKLLVEEARFYNLHDRVEETPAPRVLRSFDGTPLPPPKGAS